MSTCSPEQNTPGILRSTSPTVDFLAAVIYPSLNSNRILLFEVALDLERCTQIDTMDLKSRSPYRVKGNSKAWTGRPRFPAPGRKVYYCGIGIPKQQAGLDSVKTTGTEWYPGAGLASTSAGLGTQGAMCIGWNVYLHVHTYMHVCIYLEGQGRAKESLIWRRPSL